MSDARTSKLKPKQNSEINPGPASNENKIILPKNTTANLAEITNEEASIAYDTDQQAIVINDGSGFAPVSGGGGITWSTPVDANITVDNDNTRDLGDTGSAFSSVNSYEYWAYAQTSGMAATLKVPDDLAGNYTLTLPPDDGTTGQVLSTDGSGVLEWVDQSSSSDFTTPVTVVLPDAGDTQILQLLAPNNAGGTAMEIVIGKEYASNSSLIINERSTGVPTPVCTLSRWGSPNGIAITYNDVTITGLKAANGATGTFTTVDAKTVTVVDGIITSIV